jgi:hypothetical protein
MNTCDSRCLTNATCEGMASHARIVPVRSDHMIGIVLDDLAAEPA